MICLIYENIKIYLKTKRVFEILILIFDIEASILISYLKER